jgi:hypothetical protein
VRHAEVHADGYLDAPALDHARLHVHGLHHLLGRAQQRRARRGEVPEPTAPRHGVVGHLRALEVLDLHDEPARADRRLLRRGRGLPRLRGGHERREQAGGQRAPEVFEKLDSHHASPCAKRVGRVWEKFCVGFYDTPRRKSTFIF